VLLLLLLEEDETLFLPFSSIDDVIVDAEDGEMTRRFRQLLKSLIDESLEFIAKVLMFSKMVDVDPEESVPSISAAVTATLLTAESTAAAIVDVEGRLRNCLMALLLLPGRRLSFLVRNLLKLLWSFQIDLFVLSESFFLNINNLIKILDKFSNKNQFILFGLEIEI
jgi:hypothetical protein